MKKPIVAIVISLILLIGAALAGNSVVDRRQKEIERALKLVSDATIALSLSSKVSEGPLSKLLEEGISPADKEKSYAMYKRGRDIRLAMYREMERKVDGFKPSMQATADLLDDFGAVAGFYAAMERTSDHCADSVMYSGGKETGTPIEMSCYTMAADTYFRLLQTLSDRIKKESADLKQMDYNDILLARGARKKDGRGKQASRGNIGIILVDALRADAPGCYGGEAKTPNLDALARAGLLFERAAAPSSATQTSIPSMLSGLNPYLAGGIGASAWRSERSLVPLLKAAGYHTVAFSANTVISPHTKFDAGFSFFHLRQWAPAQVVFEDFRAHWKYEWKGEKPFFFYMHLVDPHDPYFSPDSTPELARDGRPAGMLSNPNVIRDDFVLKGIDPRDELPQGNIEYLKNLYIQEVEYADRWIGEMISFMKESGLMENTTIAIVADHGEQFMEHGDLKHSWYLFQELVHVPLILYGRLPEGYKPGTRVSDLHSTTELLPSLMAMNGMKPAGGAGGATALFSKGAGSFPVVSVTNGFPFGGEKRNTELVSLREGKYKVIIDVNNKEHRVYNLDEDPEEKGGRDEKLEGKYQEMMEKMMGLRSASGSTVVDGDWDVMKKKLKEVGYIK